MYIIHNAVMDWYKTQRLRGIEIILYWQNRLNTSDIMNAYGISRIQASKDIKQYITSYPGNMYYSLKDRAYLKAAPFTCHLSKGDVDEYIDHLSRMLKPSESMSIERLEPCYRQLNQHITSVLYAIKDSKGVDITYASMGNPAGNRRVIYPHALVNTGFRWHARAYCVKRQEFRDFNLGRILDSHGFLEGGVPNASTEHDELWERSIMIELRANPILTEEQQSLVESEFGIKRKALFVPTRACLVGYLLQRYQIDINNLDSPSKTQLLAVGNVKEIRSLLFQ